MGGEKIMKHTVQSGETLGTIAQKYLGDKSRYTQILAVNPQITNPNLIRVGEVLTIPTSTQSILSVGQSAAASTPATLLPVPVTATQSFSPAASYTSAVAPQQSLLERLQSNKKLIVMLLIGAGLFFYASSRKRA
jgi:LysM repeat protein